MTIEDWMSAIRTKYCPDCAADVKRRQIAGYMRDKRAAARERRQLERERCALLEQENELLRIAVRAKADEVRELLKMMEDGYDR
jgi:hypothetical protein